MSTRNFKILIIDDHPIVALGIRTIANKQENTECMVINNPSLMPQTVTETSFDLCIVDLQYPNKDGFTLIEQLHSLSPPKLYTHLYNAR